jgi:hypothetical protein
MVEMATAKVSIAIGRDELEAARRQAKREGLSLSAFISRAVRERVDECERQAAAERIIATYKPHERTTPEERKALVELWNRRRLMLASRSQTKPKTKPKQ